MKLKKPKPVIPEKCLTGRKVFYPESTIMSKYTNLDGYRFQIFLSKTPYLCSEIKMYHAELRRLI